MRYVFCLAVGILLTGPATAQAQIRGAIGGFGGVSINTADLAAANLGGTVTVTATPNIHFIGEAGRIGDVLPPLSGALFSLTGIALRASAVYGEGGVRLVGAPRARVSPYGEATAGVAQIRFSVTGLGPIADAAVSTATTFLDRSGPVAGVGTGLLFRAGPLLVDVGYRYKQILAAESLQTALGLGQKLRSQQVRVGMGVRF
jgi:hypothetical protein